MYSFPNLTYSRAVNWQREDRNASLRYFADLVPSLLWDKLISNSNEMSVTISVILNFSKWNLRKISQLAVRRLQCFTKILHSVCTNFTRSQAEIAIYFHVSWLFLSKQVMYTFFMMNGFVSKWNLPENSQLTIRRLQCFT